MPLTAEQADAIKRMLDTDGLDDRAALGLTSAAVTEPLIAQAYKRMALLLHPDKCDDPRATEAFKKLQHRRDAAVKSIRFGGSGFAAQPQRRRPPPHSHQHHHHGAASSPSSSTSSSDDDEDDEDDGGGYFDQSFHDAPPSTPPPTAFGDDRGYADYAWRFREAFRANEEAAAWRRATAAQERAEQARREAKGAFTSGFGAPPPRPKPHRARRTFFGSSPFPPKQADGSAPRWFAADDDDGNNHGDDDDDDNDGGRKGPQPHHNARKPPGRESWSGGSRRRGGAARGGDGGFGAAGPSSSADGAGKAWSFRPDFTAPPSAAAWADRFGRPKPPTAADGGCGSSAAAGDPSAPPPDFAEPEPAGASWDANAAAAAAARRQRRCPAFDGDDKEASPSRSNTHAKGSRYDGFGRAPPGFGSSERQEEEQPPPKPFTRVPAFAGASSPPPPFGAGGATTKPFFATAPEGDVPRDRFGFSTAGANADGAGQPPWNGFQQQTETEAEAGDGGGERWWEQASWSHAKGFSRPG